MASQKQKGGKKNRKHGRNKKQCELYRNQQTREKNKARRLKKHLSRHPGDIGAEAILKDLPKVKV